ncbi:MAG TPA: aldo/keto reductase [Bordetella sp.]
MAQVPTIALNDGNRIPQFGLGVWQVPNDEANEAVQAALAAGYRAVDTAAIYGNEEGVGSGLRASRLARKDLFITTKLWNSRHGYDEAHKAMDESLTKLGLAYVDLYLIHWPVAGSERFMDAWRAMIEMRADGRARSIGVSNFTQANLRQLIEGTGVVPAVNQIELHPAFTQVDLRVFHAKHGIVTESWSPLGQGKMMDHPVLATIAGQHGKTPAQVMIRWHLQHGLVVIPKSVTPARIRENIDVFDFTLSAEDMAAIDDIPEAGRLGPDPERFAMA